MANSTLRGERQHSDTEVNLEAGDALGGAKWTRRSEVDSEETWKSTLGRRGSDAHLTRMHLEDTTARSAPGGYGGQADLTGREDKTGGVSTVSLIRDKGMGAEDTGS